MAFSSALFWLSSLLLNFSKMELKATFYTLNLFKPRASSICNLSKQCDEQPEASFLARCWFWVLL